MTLVRREFLRLAGAGLALSASSAAWTQSYPSQPVTIVVPFTPGGATDILGRLVAKGLEQRLGKPFLVENRPGAGSLIGASAVAKAAPDGHVLLMAPSATLAMNPALYKKLPYDPVHDFVPLAGIAQTPFVLVINPALPVRSLKEFIDYAKARPGELSFASVGPGVPHHLYAELLMSMTGIKMIHIPYKGSAPALSDVVAGHIPLMFTDFPPAVGMLQTGKVRPLGVTSRTRLSMFPDIPPLAEAGLPEFDAVGWQMIVAPTKTPRDVVGRLYGELVDLIARPENDAEIARLGLLPFKNPPVDQLSRFVETEIVRWTKIAEIAGVAGSQ
jgi:tripartite-type tricarboxylate transporter receptor subunit TctC